MWSWIIVLTLFAILVLGVLGWIVRAELKNIGNLLWFVWCWVYIIRWRLLYLLRSFFVEGAIGVLLVASFYVLIDVMLTTLRALGDGALQYGFGRHLIDTGYLALLPDVPRLPPWLDVILLALAYLMMRHQWHEWKIRRRESDLPQAITKLLLDFEKVNASGGSPIARNAFLDKLMERTKEVMQAWSKRKIALALMETEKSNNQVLAITFTDPSNPPFDTKFKLAVGEGGAGIAYKKQAMVYIPSVRHEIGINIDAPQEQLGRIFIRGPKDDPFNSLLCVPVVTSSGVVGVLVVASYKRSTFWSLDFKIAKLAAAFVSIVR